MYNIHIAAHQAFDQALVSVSLSETDEFDNTHALASFRFTSAQRFEALEAGSLEEFLEQIVTGLVKALSSRTGRVLFPEF